MIPDDVRQIMKAGLSVLEQLAIVLLIGQERIENARVWLDYLPTMPVVPWEDAPEWAQYAVAQPLNYMQCVWEFYSHEPIKIEGSLYKYEWSGIGIGCSNCTEYTFEVPLGVDMRRIPLQRRSEAEE